MIDWKQVAGYQRTMRRQSERLEIQLKARLGREHARRMALVNAVTELLPIIAGNGDPHADQCFVCDHDYGHAAECAYILALAAVAEAGRSID